MIMLKNIDTGVIKKAPTGYSWTTFLFGFFPALFRGDLKWACIFFIANLAIGSITFGVGAFIFNIIFAGLYNKIYIKELLSKRFTYADETARSYLVKHNIISNTIDNSTNVIEDKTTK